MIVSENDIYDTISDALREEYGSSIYLTGLYVDVPAKFPAVTIIKINDVVYERMRTREQIENAAIVTYEVNVYTNNVVSKKSDAQKIIAIVDETFASMNFTRIMLNPVSNLQDATIYRLVGRYRAVIDRDLWLYTT